MEEQLAELNGIVGIRGSFVCTRDGRIIARRMPPSIDGEQMSVVARVAAQTFQAIGVSGNRANEIDFLFEEGRMILKDLRLAILVLYCDSVLNLPLVNLNANGIIKKLNAELKAHEPLLMPAKPESSPRQSSSSGAEMIPNPERPASNANPVNAYAPRQEGPLTKRLRQSPAVAEAPAASQEEATSRVENPAPAPRIEDALSIPEELQKQDLETRRLIEGCADKHLTLRASGTVAVRWHCHRPHTWLTVPDNYRTLDFCGLGSESSALVECLSGLGYRLNEGATKSLGNNGLIFDAQGWWFRVQVSLNFLQMFQRLDISRHLAQDPFSLSPSLLLLAYLEKTDPSQVELQELSALCLDHPLGAGNSAADQIDLDLLCQLFGNDWGWYRAAEMSLAGLAQKASNWLDEAESKQLDKWIGELTRAMQQAPKSLRWRLRSVAG